MSLASSSVAGVLVVVQQRQHIVTYCCALFLSLTDIGRRSGSSQQGNVCVCVCVCVRLVIASYRIVSWLVDSPLDDVVLQTHRDMRVLTFFHCNKCKKNCHLHTLLTATAQKPQKS